MEGRIQKTPVNGELLKEYIDRSNFEVIVRIWWDSNFLGGDNCNPRYQDNHVIGRIITRRINKIPNGIRINI